MSKSREVRPALDRLRRDAADCQACPLWRTATQTVFGEGSRGARIMLVGEQPGDQEDRAGQPFVGPAGRILRDALQQAGIDEADVYVTNAVKHFKWRPSGKRRLHERPNLTELAACRMWLELEIQAVEPRIIVALGATAARTLLGRTVRVIAERGQQLPSPFRADVTVTVHPSSVLRVPDSAARAEAMARLVDDLRAVRAALTRS